MNDLLRRTEPAPQQEDGSDVNDANSSVTDTSSNDQYLENMIDVEEVSAALSRESDSLSTEDSARASSATSAEDDTVYSEAGSSLSDMSDSFIDQSADADTVVNATAELISDISGTTGIEGIKSYLKSTHGTLESPIQNIGFPSTDSSEEQNAIDEVMRLLTLYVEGLDNFEPNSAVLEELEDRLDAEFGDLMTVQDLLDKNHLWEFVRLAETESLDFVTENWDLVPELRIMLRATTVIRHAYGKFGGYIGILGDLDLSSPSVEKLTRGFRYSFAHKGNSATVNAGLVRFMRKHKVVPMNVFATDKAGRFKSAQPAYKAVRSAMIAATSGTASTLGASALQRANIVLNKLSTLYLEVDGKDLGSFAADKAARRRYGAIKYRGGNLRLDPKQLRKGFLSAIDQQAPDEVAKLKRKVGMSRANRGIWRDMPGRVIRGAARTTNSGKAFAARSFSGSLSLYFTWCYYQDIERSLGEWISYETRKDQINEMKTRRSISLVDLLDEGRFSIMVDRRETREPSMSSGYGDLGFAETLKTFNHNDYGASTVANLKPLTIGEFAGIFHDWILTGEGSSLSAGSFKKVRDSIRKGMPIQGLTGHHLRSAISDFMGYGANRFFVRIDSEIHRSLSVLSDPENNSVPDSLGYNRASFDLFTLLSYKLIPESNPKNLDYEYNFSMIDLATSSLNLLSDNATLMLNLGVTPPGYVENDPETFAENLRYQASAYFKYNIPNSIGVDSGELSPYGAYLYLEQNLIRIQEETMTAHEAMANIIYYATFGSVGAANFLRQAALLTIGAGPAGSNAAANFLRILRVMKLQSGSIAHISTIIRQVALFRAPVSTIAWATKGRWLSGMLQMSRSAPAYTIRGVNSAISALKLSGVVKFILLKVSVPVMISFATASLINFGVATHKDQNERKWKNRLGRLFFGPSRSTGNEVELRLSYDPVVSPGQVIDAYARDDSSDLETMYLANSLGSDLEHTTVRDYYITSFSYAAFSQQLGDHATEFIQSLAESSEHLVFSGNNPSNKQREMMAVHTFDILTSFK